MHVFEENQDSAALAECPLSVTYPDALSTSIFGMLRRKLRLDAVEDKYRDGHDFFDTPFWVDFETGPRCLLESLIGNLAQYVSCEDCVGAEWWLSVRDVNWTPLWVVEPHTDIENKERDMYSPDGAVYPKYSSVFFLRTLPYGELVVMDQVVEDGEATPSDPIRMDFIKPVTNTYAVFVGNLFHAVVGRMWRAKQNCQLRIALAVNYWRHKPRVDYLKPTSEYHDFLGVDS